MVTRIRYTGNDTVRRYPRTLHEAFPHDRPLWHDVESRVSPADLLYWVLSVLLLLAILFAPSIWEYLNA